MKRSTLEPGGRDLTNLKTVFTSLMLENSTNIVSLSWCWNSPWCLILVIVDSGIPSCLLRNNLSLWSRTSGDGGYSECGECPGISVTEIGENPRVLLAASKTGLVQENTSSLLVVSWKTGCPGAVEKKSLVLSQYLQQCGRGFHCSLEGYQG